MLENDPGYGHTAAITCETAILIGCTYVQLMYRLWLSNGKEVRASVCLVYPDPVEKLKPDAKEDSVELSAQSQGEAQASYQWRRVLRGKSLLAASGSVHARAHACTQRR